MPTQLRPARQRHSTRTRQKCSRQLAASGGASVLPVLRLNTLPGLSIPTCFLVSTSAGLTAAPASAHLSGSLQQRQGAPRGASCGCRCWYQRSEDRRVPRQHQGRRADCPRPAHHPIHRGTTPSVCDFLLVCGSLVLSLYLAAGRLDVTLLAGRWDWTGHLELDEVRPRQGGAFSCLFPPATYLQVAQCNHTLHGPLAGREGIRRQEED